MAKRKGELQKVAIYVDSAYVEIGKVTDLSASLSTKEVDMSDFDSDGWEESEAGDSTGSLSITCNYDEADTGQEAALNAFYAKSKDNWYWRGATGTGNAELVAPCYITACERSGARGAAQQLKITLKIAGKPTEDDQTEAEPPDDDPPEVGGGGEG